MILRKFFLFSFPLHLFSKPLTEWKEVYPETRRTKDNDASVDPRYHNFTIWQGGLIWVDDVGHNQAEEKRDKINFT